VLAVGAALGMCGPRPDAPAHGPADARAEDPGDDWTHG
jgi:hypothetical protein